jgi:hypothetical protein
VKASSAPCSASALAIPQAIERLFATPMISPRLPCINPAISAKFHSSRFVLAYHSPAPRASCWKPALFQRMAGPASQFFVYRPFLRRCVTLFTGNLHGAL